MTKDSKELIDYVIRTKYVKENINFFTDYDMLVADQSIQLRFKYDLTTNNLIIYVNLII